MEMDGVKMSKVKKEDMVSSSGHRKGKVRMRNRKTRTKEMWLVYSETSVRRK